VAVALSGGQVLGDAAYADLDSFPMQTLLYYRSIVTSRSPTQSRPPSAYRLVWQGRWYQLWERPATADEMPATPLAHIPGGDSNKLPYCGIANPRRLPLCSVVPASAPPCSIVKKLGTAATHAQDRLVAFQRQAPLVARATQAQSIPPGWDRNAASGWVIPTRTGTMTFHIQIDVAEHYRLWLGGSFRRGFDVSVDGHALGRVRNLRQSYWTYTSVSTVALAHGQHTIALTYPGGDLGPGGGVSTESLVFAVALDPQDGPKSQMLDVAGSDAKSLCGRSLDWIEVVKPHA
jgi:hypothetical protein